MSNSPSAASLPATFSAMTLRIRRVMSGWPWSTAQTRGALGVAVGVLPAVAQRADVVGQAGIVQVQAPDAGVELHAELRAPRDVRGRPDNQQVAGELAGTQPALAGEAQVEGLSLGIVRAQQAVADVGAIAEHRRVAAVGHRAAGSVPARRRRAPSRPPARCRDRAAPRPSPPPDAASSRDPLVRARATSPCSWWAPARSSARHRSRARRRRPHRTTRRRAARRRAARRRTGARRPSVPAFDRWRRRHDRCGGGVTASGDHVPSTSGQKGRGISWRAAAMAPCRTSMGCDAPGPTSHCATMAARFLYSSASCGETLAIGLRKAERRHAAHVEHGQGPLARRGRIVAMLLDQRLAHRGHRPEPLERRLLRGLQRGGHFLQQLEHPAVERLGDNVRVTSR